MFSVEQDEIFHFFPIPPRQPTIPRTTLKITADSSEPISCRKKRKSSVAFVDNNVLDSKSLVEHRKRKIHTEVERRRRQEMASLHQSLRSLVPNEYLQGKRSISELIHGTVRCVRQLKKKVDELMNKRDELQQLMKLGSSFFNLSEFSLSHNKTSVTVQRSTAGMQIILNTTFRGGLPLSRFLSVLNGEGLAVISCISTKVNAGQIHVMESEVDEGRSFDQTKLQKRLRDLLYNL